MSQAAENLNDEVPDSGDDLRADLEAAFTQLEAGGGNDEANQALERQDAGYQEPAENPLPSGQPAGDEVHNQANGAAAPDNQGQPPGGVDASTPPSSWKPQHRENWSKVPDDLKLEIKRREGDFERVLGNVAVERKIAQEFRAAITPYQQLMAVEGIQNPIEGIKGLMQTSATLRMGTPQQKAEMMARMVQGYGIDIDTLDKALVAQQSGKPMAPPPPQQPMSDPRVDQLFAALQTRYQENQQQVSVQNQQTIQQFAADPQNRFFGDVRLQMADIMEAAQTDLSMEDAYAAACMANPDVRPLFIRQMQQAGVNTAGSSARAAAGSSVYGSPGGVSTVRVKNDTVEDAVRSAWDQLENGNRV